MADEPRRLVLLGGGHAHLSVLERLAAQPLPGWSVTLVTPHRRQLYSGMLPGWVAGIYTIDELSIPLDALSARAGVAFEATTAIGLDLEHRALLCADGRRLRFELLSIDIGAQAAIGSLPGAVEHAVPVRPLEAFVTGWRATIEHWPALAATPFDVLIVGSGAAAVELAFAVRQQAVRSRATGVRITLVGADAEPMASSPPATQRRISSLLRAAGIRWRGRCRATRVLPGALALDVGETMPFDACLVATGAAAADWPREAGLVTDAGGFIRVDRALRSVSHPQVFAAGDAAAYAEPRAKSGVFAVRAGPVLADNLFAACLGSPLRDWSPQKRALYLFSSADGRAVASWGPWAIGGRWAWRWKDWIDRRFVQRFRSRGPRAT